jgi:hypothetical protein
MSNSCRPIIVLVEILRGGEVVTGRKHAPTRAFKLEIFNTGCIMVISGNPKWTLAQVSEITLHGMSLLLAVCRRSIIAFREKGLPG